MAQQFSRSRGSRDECRSVEESVLSVVLVEEDATTYAKTEVGTQSFETNILGIPCNKKSDELTISLSRCADTGNEGVLTKMKMMSVINGVFDPLGFVSSVIIIAKILYSQVCKGKL